MTYIGIIITYTFVQNFVLVELLGLCPFVDVSRKPEAAVGLGLAVTFVMSLSSLLTWVVFHVVLVPLGLGFLQVLTFLLVIVALVQFLDLVMQRVSSALYRMLGSYLPLITANCAILGIALIAVRSQYNALESLVAGFAAGGGFLLVTVLMAVLRERLELEWVPKPFRGIPAAFISAGLMAMAFLAFDKAFLSGLLG